MRGFVLSFCRVAFKCSDVSDGPTVSIFRVNILVQVDAEFM